VKVSLFTDTTLCTGCLSCETACKQEHNLPVGPKLIKVLQIGPSEAGGKLTMHFLPSHCRHCSKPPCLDDCPVQAIYKQKDGRVIFNEELCIGCKQCMVSCPFGAPQFNPEKDIVQNCDMCRKRSDQGLVPACVQNCPNGALIIGDPAAFSEHIRNKQMTGRY